MGSEKSVQKVALKIGAGDERAFKEKIYLHHKTITFGQKQQKKCKFK